MSAKIKGGGKETKKMDDYVGHHAVVSGLDTKSQKLILNFLGERFPGMRFLTEEKVVGMHHRRILPVAPTEDDLGNSIAVVDPLDGSSSRIRHHWEWSVSVGHLVSREFSGGAVVAPALNGGISAVGQVGIGTWYRMGRSKWTRAKIRDRAIEDYYILLGPDLLFNEKGLRDTRDFIPAVARSARTVNVTGSSPLGLIAVVAGIADAIVQPVQCPWDFAAGAPCVCAAGGKVIWWHYRSGKPVRMGTPDLATFRKDTRATAYIAGAPRAAEWLFKLLVKHWRR